MCYCYKKAEKSIHYKMIELLMEHKEGASHPWPGTLEGTMYRKVALQLAKAVHRKYTIHTEEVVQIHQHRKYKYTNRKYKYTHRKYKYTHRKYKYTQIGSTNTQTGSTHTQKLLGTVTIITDTKRYKKQK